jgi:hypothetical protein
MVLEHLKIHEKPALQKILLRRVVQRKSPLLKNGGKTCSAGNQAPGRNLGLERTRTDVILKTFI